MAIEVTLPRLSPGMNEASVSRWLKKQGQSVTQGEALFEVETEKVATEVVAAASGTLSILVQENKTVAIGTVLAYLLGAGEQAPVATSGAIVPLAQGVANPPSAVPAAVTPPPPVSSAGAAVMEPTRTEDDGRQIASPAARRLAGELRIDWRALTGRGPGGRVIEKDVLEASAKGVVIAAQAAAAVPASVVPSTKASIPIEARTIAMKGMRRVIADRMLQSQNTNATVTASLEVDMREATNLRQQLIGEWEKGKGVRVTFTDILVKAVSKALLEHPRLNSSLRGDQIVENADVHMGVAVALDDGLIVPVLRNAHQKSILEISRAIKDLGERARGGKLSVSEVSGGTFTISNLGTSGVDFFTPIINPPECAILGVGKISSKAVVRDELVVVRPMMWLSLTFDHRIVDGYPAGVFLHRIQEILEKPYLLFV